MKNLFQQFRSKDFGKGKRVDRKIPINFLFDTSIDELVIEAIQYVSFPY